MAKQLTSILLLLCACSSNINHWMVDGIATGNRSFDSKRLRYQSPQVYPPLTFEMLRVGDQVEAFLSLTRHRLPAEPQLKILFTIANQPLEELAQVHEGRMRIRLSPETTQKLIQALQDGEKVAILLDGFEEILDPSQFSSSFAEFLGGGSVFQNLFKGPL